MTGYGERLARLVAARGPLCAGIDPHPALLTQWGLPVNARGLERCARTMVDTLGDLVPVLKPQSAFFEMHGSAGIAVLERVLGELGDVRVGVLEGDVQGSLDADRLASLHVPVVQLNTDGGFGGECHLDANMVRSAIPDLDLSAIDLLVIENIGNLVCPAEFRVGEDVRAMITSVTEGEDKPLKYPTIFRKADLVLLTKVDLLPVLRDISVDRIRENLSFVMPRPTMIPISATTGEGVVQWVQWLNGIGRVHGTQCAAAGGLHVGAS